MVKVDNGPEGLAKAITLGFEIYLGVPNTMAVTQVMNQNYGPFKTQFVKNLKLVPDARIMGDLPTSLPPWMFGLIVFGGIDMLSNIVVSKSASEIGFYIEKKL